MASLTTTIPSSPTSLQLLRFDRRSRGFVRFRCPNRCIRSIAASRASATGGESKGSSWNGSNPSTDSFAGWSSADGGDSPKKGGIGVILGAGLAGVCIVAGLTFASFSLRSRTTSGVKPQMEPLTIEQEVFLNSDDEKLKVDQVADGSNALLPAEHEHSKIDCHSDCEAGTTKDPFPFLENNEDASECRLNIHHLEDLSVLNHGSTDNGVDGMHQTSNHADLQIGPDANIAEPSDLKTSSPELSKHVVVDFSSDIPRFKDSNSTISSDPQESIIIYDANLGTNNNIDLSSYSSDSINPTSDHWQRNFSSEETVNSKVSLNFSSGYEEQSPTESLTSNLMINESGDIVGSHFKDVVETAASVSKEQYVEQGGMLQLPADAAVMHDVNEIVASGAFSGSNSEKNEPSKLQHDMFNSAEGHESNESAPSIEYSAPVLADLNRNETDISSHSLIGRSLLPERTFSYAGIPAPSLVSAALQFPPGKVLVPAVVDHVQGQALAALQVLKVIEADVQPGDLCTRREYARWLVSASNALSRNTVSKVYPAMYIENVTELAFDDITPKDPDFSSIQGLAEAGIISSRLSRSDLYGSYVVLHDPYLFSPESSLSRQDLVSWKMALEKNKLPEVNRNNLYQCSGYIDIDKINPDAWPALVADLSAGEQGITALAFGYTRLFQPNKPVTVAQAAIALSTGETAEIVEEELTRIEAESLAESAVNAHTALVEQVEKDLNVSYEKELAKEREKIDTVEKMFEETRLELERLRAEREEENNALIRGRAAVESEMEILSKLRSEVEEQLQELMSNKVEIAFERDRINKLRKEAEGENQVIVQLQYELEIERKALAMARNWAEEEAKRVREQARALEEARGRWEKHGIKVVVDEDLQDVASTGMPWLTAGEQPPVVETINNAESLVEKLRAMACGMKLKSSHAIEKAIQKIEAIISILKQWASQASKHAVELRSKVSSTVSKSIDEFRGTASGLNSTVGEKARRVVEDCKESVDRFTHKFKT